MSCLPLFSFGPSISAALRLDDSSKTVTSKDNRRETPSMASESAHVVDGLYDKLAQVSVSHRRVDSFEWVMTQSAPNTPPASLASKCDVYSPPPTRSTGSAPLPVPNEIWSTSLRPLDGRQKRAYFDWWPSPTLGSNKGYMRLSTTEDEDQADLESPSRGRKSVAEPSQSLGPEIWTQTPISPSSEGDQLRPLQELNALGIVFPCTPPPSPPASRMPRALELKSFPREASPQLPKRVSFSPIIDEVSLESCSNRPTGQHSSSWVGYLPSSFLVARPPLTRATSSPVPRRTMASRPILKHSSSTYQQPVHDTKPTTEMIPLSAKTDDGNTAVVSSSIPKQRLSVATSRGDGRRQLGDNSGDTDSAFVAVLQDAYKPARRRCDSLLSNTSRSLSDECKS